MINKHNTKDTIHDKMDFIKMWNFCTMKVSRDWEDKPQTGRKYFQKTCTLIKSFDPLLLSPFVRNGCPKSLYKELL